MNPGRVCRQVVMTFLNLLLNTFLFSFIILLAEVRAGCIPVIVSKWFDAYAGPLKQRMIPLRNIRTEQNIMY